MESKNLADLYDLPPLAWEGVIRRLDEGVSQAPDTGGPDRHTCWLATIDPDFSAPSAGPSPWHVYRIAAHRVTALATIEPGGATRWTFDPSEA